MALNVAVTGPTGEIGKPLMSELERRPEVGSVLGMARRPFDPAAEGWEKVTYRNLTGGIVAVHRAFKAAESTPDNAAAAIAAHKGPVAKLRRNITR